MVRTTIFSLSAIIIAAPAIQANFLDFDFEEFLKEYDFKFTSTTAEPTTEEIDFNANARSYGPADFEALKFQVNGPFRDANDDQPCRDLQADTLRNLENTGYLDCMFPKINNSSDFERVTTDCAGQPLDASQAWYRPKVPFEGKPNSLYYASMVQGKPADNHQFCTDTDVNNGNMPLGSMSWCPWNQTEAAWMWHHHPAQPFQASTSQSINTLYTGIWAEDNSGNADKKWFCGQGIEDESHEDFRGPSDHKFFNWADGEPNFGKHRSVHFQMLVPDMVDARPSKTGYFYCELNCDLLTICEALACERNDASCVDTGDLATSECVCNDNALTWNPNTKTCSDDTTTEPTTTTTTTTEETTTTTTEETTTTTTEETTTTTTEETTTTTEETTTTTTEETTTTTEETTTTTEETTTTTTEEPTTTTTTTTDFTTTTNATTTTTDETSTSTEEFTSTTTTVPEYLTSTTSTTTTDEPTTTTTDYTTTTTSTTSTTTTEEPTTTTTTTTDFTTTTNATTTTEEPTTDETSTTEFTTSEEITTTSVEETTTSTTSTESTTSEIAPTSTSAEETTSTTSTTTTTTDATSTTSTSTTEEVTSPSPIVNVKIPTKFQGMKKMLQYILFSILNPQGQKTWTVHFRARRDTNSTIISESDLEQLFEHGCHCHKLDQEKNVISNIGSGAVLDEMDSICRDWLNARKCITYAGGSCFALAGEESYQLQINTQTNELDCSLNSGASQCVQDACYIDAQYAGFILGEIQNNYENTGFVAIQGDNVSCPNNVGLLAPVGCSGIAPNVEIIRELP